MQKVRFLPLLCVLLMLFSAPTLLAQQAPDTPYPAETVLSSHTISPAERTLRIFLYPKLIAQDAEIPLPAGTSYDLLVQTMQAMRDDYPELFHIESSYIVYLRNQPDIAQSLKPVYKCSAEEAAALRASLLETAQSWVDANPDPLALFDCLARSTAYSAENEWHHTAVGALLYGEATCEGYSQAISLLYRLAGIPCGLVTGDAVSNDGEIGVHAWNVTNFGFLDATWASVLDGHVLHSNYAMAEAEMRADHTPADGFTFPDMQGVQNYYQSHGLFVSTDAELAVQLARLADGETVEVQFSPDLYARYAGQMANVLNLCAEASGMEIPFYGACRYLLDERRFVLMIVPE